MNRPAQLAIGASYLASLGHAELEGSFVAALELGFDGVLPCPLPKPLAWAEAPGLLDRLPLGIPAIRVESPFELLRGTLASSSPDDIELVHARVARAAELGRRLDCRTLILEAPVLPGTEDDAVSYADRVEPGPEQRVAVEQQVLRERERHLEHACRNLHELAGRFAEFQICITESARLASLSGPEDLRTLLDELPRQPCGYWHRAAVAARRESLGGAEAGESLEMLSKYLRGMGLEDGGATGVQELPGSGRVDYGMLTPYLRRDSGDLPAGLELEPGLPPAALPRATSFLEKFGLQARGSA
jgi:hypothetical protein